ncbi:MAG: hypothetical protein RL120_00090 [Gammaproteobacteria bacterium]
MADQKESGRFLVALGKLFTISPRTKPLELRFVFWTLLWAIALVISKFVTRNELVTGFWAWLFPTAAVLLSLVSFYCYYDFLMKSDELTRKIQLDGISFAFGFGILLTMAIEAFEHLGAPSLSSNDVFTIMVFAWVLGQFWGHMKYQ